MIVVCVAAPVNNHDSVLLPLAVAKLVETTKRLDISLAKIPFTLDSGFDGKVSDLAVRTTGMIPVIKPNLRNTKDKKKITARTRAFKKVEAIYKGRYVVERGFAWEDKYRKLVVRYERLEATFSGFRYLAGTMVNYRTMGNAL